jgi:hypothetical protein
VPTPQRAEEGSARVRVAGLGDKNFRSCFHAHGNSGSATSVSCGKMAGSLSRSEPPRHEGHQESQRSTAITLSALGVGLSFVLLVSWWFKNRLRVAVGRSTSVRWEKIPAECRAGCACRPNRPVEHRQAQPALQSSDRTRDKVRPSPSPLPGYWARVKVAKSEINVCPVGIKIPGGNKKFVPGGGGDPFLYGAKGSPAALWQTSQAPGVRTS